MKAIITKGPLFKEVEKNAYQYLYEILSEKAKNIEKEMDLPGCSENKKRH